MGDRGNSPSKCILYSSPALAPLTLKELEFLGCSLAGEVEFSPPGSLSPMVYFLFQLPAYLGGERQRWNFCPGSSLSYAFSADFNAFVSACPFIVA
jgi:hypothetical protein